jgi:hypothetical protein
MPRESRLALLHAGGEAVEFIRRVYENAKVTIPKELRELHGIQTGDFVKLRIVEVIPAKGRNGEDAATEEKVATVDAVAEVER